MDNEYIIDVLNVAKERILELHGEHDRDYSCETLEAIDNAINYLLKNKE